jgi:hypothetical protein
VSIDDIRVGAITTSCSQQRTFHRALWSVHLEAHYGTGEIPASRPGKLIEPGLVCFKVYIGL